MNAFPIASVINFCTNEIRFLRACIEQCRVFSQQILIPVCDHFFDGTAERRELLEQIYKAFPDCLFIEYPYAPEQIAPSVFRSLSPDHFWHSASRLLAYHFLKEGIERVLFLDADEVPDGSRFSKWLAEGDFTQYSVLKMANYWYFREPCYQAQEWEDSIVFAQKYSLDPSLLLQDAERNAIYDGLPGPKRRNVVSLDGQPMFHHFSWVRTKEEMLKKVEKWGHRNDRDWKSLIEQEFSGPFRGEDFIHGYRFRSCEPLFSLSLEQRVSLPAEARQPAQVRRLRKEDLADWLGVPQAVWTRRIRSFLRRIID